MHATNSLGQWLVETLATFDSVVGICRMVLDHEGDAHILLYEEHSYDFENRSFIYRLHYLCNESGAWNDEIIDTYQGMSGSLQLPTAELIVDSQNEVHIAYLTRNLAGDHHIRTAVLSNGTWRNNLASAFSIRYIHSWTQRTPTTAWQKGPRKAGQK
jgi:hypothetical protein